MYRKYLVRYFALYKLSLSRTWSPEAQKVDKHWSSVLDFLFYRVSISSTLILGSFFGIQKSYEQVFVKVKFVYVWRKEVGRIAVFKMSVLRCNFFNTFLCFFNMFSWRLEKCYFLVNFWVIIFSIRLIRRSSDTWVFTVL